MSKAEPIVVELVARILGARIEERAPAWLSRPDRDVCGRMWEPLAAIYSDLTEMTLPEQMPANERRKVDAILLTPDGRRVLEYDGRQHFNQYRAITLAGYPDETAMAFPLTAFLDRSRDRKRLATGGWGVPKPPLFPQEDGRHRQRAFRDAVADLVPLEHGFLPTLRIADFEVRRWIHKPEAEMQMRELLRGRC